MSTATAPHQADNKMSLREMEMTKELATARSRIQELESKVSTLEAALKRKPETPIAEPASKKQKTVFVSPAPPSVDAKRVKMIRKRLVNSIKCSLKGVKFYGGWDTTDRKINVTDMMTLEEYNALVGNHGTLIQPTPSNKPKSSVHIHDLNGGDIEHVLGTNKFKGELWTKGGQRSFFGGFSKSIKISGGVEVVISSAEAKFACNSQQLTLKCVFINSENSD